MNTQPANCGEVNFTRIDIQFKSKGTLCAAWLYLPEGLKHPPVVIMAHGFGAERSFRLPAYAERFAREGMACFVFDYRNFGDSQGEPRNYIHPARHLEDWQAAINHARSLDSVDGTRMALWGTSFSGGHVIVTAARTTGIMAIVAQIPFVDGRSSSRRLGYKLQAVFHALWDMIGAMALNRRHYVPIAGNPDRFAMLNTPDALEGAQKLLPPGIKPGSRQCPADIGIRLAFYRPIKYAQDVRCPALIVYAEQDTLISPGIVKKTVQRMPKATAVCLPVKHFDVYEDEPFEKTVRLESDFLKKHLFLNPTS